MIKLEYLMELLGHRDLVETRDWCRQHDVVIDEECEVELVDLEELFKHPPFRDFNSESDEA